MAYALVSKTNDLKVMRVRPPPTAQKEITIRGMYGSRVCAQVVVRRDRKTTERRTM